MAASVVCISRSLGAGGEQIGQLVAERLGFRYVDEEIVARAAESEGLDAKDVASASTSQLDSAWDSFSAAVKNVPSDASVSDALNDVSQSAQTLVSTTQSTISGLSCS